MSRRRASATALKVSEVVAARAMNALYSHIGICQGTFLATAPLLSLCPVNCRKYSVLQETKKSGSPPSSQQSRLAPILIQLCFIRSGCTLEETHGERSPALVFTFNIPTA